MADSEIKRVNFYKDIPLVDIPQDKTVRLGPTFTAEQAYHEAVARLHNRRMHTWGVVYGLEVTASADKRSVEVGPGLAIDKEGQEIYLAGSTSKKVHLKNNQPCFVTAGYYLADGDPSADKIQKGTEAPFWRMLVQAKLDSAPTEPKPPDSVIVLARVEQDKDGTVKIDQSVRRSAGAVLNPNADIDARGLTLTGAATLQKGLTVSGGSTELKNGLTVENALTIAADGTASFKKGLTVENALTIAADGTASFKKGLTVENALTIAADGTATFKKGLTVENTLTTLQNGLTVNGGLTVQGGLTVETGAATFRKGLTVEGGATLSSAVRLGDFTKDDKREFDKIVWLKDDNDASWNEQLLKYSSQDGHFKHGGFGIHMHKTREFGIWSSGPVELFSVEGGSGNAWIKGGLTVEGDVTLKNKLSFAAQVTKTEGTTTVEVAPAGLTVEVAATLKKTLTVTGNVSTQTTAGKNTVDIQNANRSTLPKNTTTIKEDYTHPTGLALYVTAESNPDGKGVEFRHSNGSQGIGFGYSTIYATGHLDDQALILKARGKSAVQIESCARIKQEDWKEVGPNGVVNFEHSWSTNYLAGVGQFVAFFKDSLGIVHLRGFVINRHDHEGPCIFKLPEGYRPATLAAYIVPAEGRSGVGYLEIENDQVRCRGTPGDYDKIYLDGVTFRAK